MLAIYKFLSKILQLILNVLFVIQISLMILVFLTATYWFLNLIDVHVFDFVSPIAEFVSNIVRLFYHRDVEIGGVYIDPSILLFDLIAVVIVFMTPLSKRQCSILLAGGQ